MSDNCHYLIQITVQVYLLFRLEPIDRFDRLLECSIQSLPLSFRFDPYHHIITISQFILVSLRLLCPILRCFFYNPTIRAPYMAEILSNSQYQTFCSLSSLVLWISLIFKILTTSFPWGTEWLPCDSDNSSGLCDPLVQDKRCNKSREDESVLLDSASS